MQVKSEELKSGIWMSSDSTGIRIAIGGVACIVSYSAYIYIYIYYKICIYFSLFFSLGLKVANNPVWNQKKSNALARPSLPMPWQPWNKYGGIWLKNAGATRMYDGPVLGYFLDHIMCVKHVFLCNFYFSGAFLCKESAIKDEKEL